MVKTTPVQKLKAKIAVLHDKITVIQTACPHPPVHVTYQYDSNTGNWDRGDDGYWTNIKCALCERRWTVDGSPSVAGTRIEKKDGRI